MRQLIDGVLHISDLPALIAWFAQDENGFVEPHVVVGFARTPTVQSGTAALVYIRMTEAQAEEWSATPRRHDPRTTAIRTRCTGRALCRSVLRCRGHRAL